MRRLVDWFLTLGALSVMATSAMAAAPAPRDVLDTYADIALAGYEDSLTTAKALQAKIEAFLAEPTEERLAEAKAAWLAARVPYQQTEVFRFGNRIVDDWEGKVNAWPLDEGLIDYVDGDYGTESEENPLYVANIIANPSVRISGRMVDASKITKELLSDTLHEAGGVEANVATGYHAIEFLLWGQDLNGTDAGAGARPASDYDTANCTGGNCERRAQYLRTVTELLVDDLTWMVEQWKADGAARKALTADETQGLVAIFTGLGSLSYGELAGERMKLGLLLNDPEEEHDCFSDNTHNSHYYDLIGIRNVYFGKYERIDGSVISGPSVSDLVKAKDAEIDARVRDALDESLAQFETLKKRAETVEAYDQMIGEANDEGNAVVEAALQALIAQTREFERAIAALELGAVQFEGSDSLDNPSKVFQ
ncbi:MAG TPA: imelysin family protein [Hyphomicrobiaceae bacterium]|jgi:putative iron-regulated protein